MKIIIIGGKGTSVNIAEQILDAKYNYNQDIDLLGFAIDDPTLGDNINNIPILCKIHDISSFVSYNDVFIIYSLYRPDLMKQRSDLLYSLNIPINKFASFIHPSAIVNRSVKIGAGNVILSNCSILTNVVIGNHNIINSNVVIEHDTNIGSNNFIAASCCIGSSVTVKDYSFIGLNTTVREKVLIDSNTFIGMGSNVLSSTYENSKVFGNPARTQP